ncbi:MAG TPA: response regulator [Tepidisphaeraceae bacterium]|nr:response regulator [Tepidisphaeraceae bacterium]
MIVEDDHASRTAMRYLLAHHGWHALDAANLSQGRALLIGQMPAVLLLDLMLPDGDGADLLRHIRQEKLPVLVVVVTGIGDPGALDTVRQLNPDLLFRKPVNVHSLLQWLDSNRP